MHHRDERPEESRARMYLNDRDDFGARYWKPAPEYLEAQKEEIKEIVLARLKEFDSSLCNLVEDVLATVKPKPPLHRIAGVFRTLYEQNIIEIFDFTPHRLSLRDLDVHIRMKRPDKPKRKLGTAC